MKTSTDTDKIVPAYIKAEHTVGSVKKTASNPHFKSKYANLEAVMEACSEALDKNGLAIWQSITEEGDRMITRLYHTSGQWMEGYTPLIIAKNDMQGLGSAYTYARRYGLMAIMGIAPEDDDGNAASATIIPLPVKKAEPKKVETDHVEEAKSILSEAKQISDAKELDWFLKKNAQRIADIREASTVTHEYLQKRINERRQEINKEIKNA
jgi:hypothetical protein